MFRINKPKGLYLLNIIILTSLLLALSASTNILTTPRYASATLDQSWYDTAWLYRRPVTLTNSGTALTNYQVKITLDSSFDFSKAESDGSDIRVIDSDGITPLPFWIETWDPGSTAASIWTKVTSIPVGDSTIYLYYGNSSASSNSDGNSTFEFFDNFESLITAEGYYELSTAQTVLVEDQTWEDTAPHTLSVVEVNSDGFQYWGYYGLQAGNGGVGLARSNDLSTWVKYGSDPLFLNGRFPSVIKVGGTFYMMVTKNYSGTSHVVLRTSTDGIAFTETETVVAPESGVRNQNPNLFYNPNDSLYYLYWFRNSSLREIRARSAAAVEDLDIASDIVVLSSPSTLAAPNMMYYDNTYFLATEINPGGEWQVRIYESTSPTSGFTELPDNPILEDGSACFFQHIFGTTLHGYYCKLTGGNWTVDYRSADLTAGRKQIPQALDPSKWTPTGGTWTIESAIQQDGTTGYVAQGTTKERQILLSSFTSDDYVMEAYGKQVDGRVWGLSVRATDTNNLYFNNLYEDLDSTPDNLYIYRRLSGSGTTVASTDLGTIDLNTWYKMTVKVHSTDIDVYINDVLELQGSDAGLSSGRVALYGENNTIAQFDNVMVRKYAADEPTALVGTEEIYDPTGVIIASFSAHPQGRAILVNWATGNETEVIGFNLFRSGSLSGIRSKLNSTIIQAKALGTPTGASYEYLDSSVVKGATYYYWLELVNTSGPVFHNQPAITVGPFVTSLPIIINR